MKDLCKKIYEEFFYISKHGKIREKVMQARIVAAVAIVLLCLAAMSVTAYAYFSYNISSGSSIIKAAHFETKVSIQITDENGEAVDINPITSDYQSFKVALEAGEKYHITIVPTDNNTAQTGFMILTAKGCKETYHTQQLGVDSGVSGGKTESISFTLQVTDDTDLKLLAHWGTSSYYDAYKNKGENEELYITGDEDVTMIVNGIAAQSDEPGEEQEEPTPPAEESTDKEAAEENVTPPAAEQNPPKQEENDDAGEGDAPAEPAPEEPKQEDSSSDVPSDPPAQEEESEQPSTEEPDPSEPPAEEQGE